jgi:hypothetical protein
MKRRFPNALRGVLLSLGLSLMTTPVWANEVKVQMRFDDSFTSAVGTAGAPFTAFNFNNTGPRTFTDLVTIINPGSVTFENATINGGSARVARFPSGTSFTLNHNIAPNGGGEYVNQYTLIFDMRIDSTSSGWAVLFQTGVDNTNDGDGFIRGSDLGIGISGNYVDNANDYTPFANPLRFTPGVWQRVVVSIDTNTSNNKRSGYRVYIDGKLQNIVQNAWGEGGGVDGRFSLDPIIHILADEDGETSDTLLNNFQMRDYAMSDAEVAALGKATAGAIETTIRPTSTVSGTVKLNGLGANSPTQTVVIAARSGAETLFYRVLDNVGAETPLTLPGLLRGQTELFFTTPKHLNAKRLVDTSGGDVTNFMIELAGGDGNADNVVDITDLLTLIGVYNKTLLANPTEYLQAVDFNGDGANDITDLLTIIGSYNKLGDI